MSPEKQPPHINIIQSAMIVPPQDQLSIALDMKILPDRNVPDEPFFGIWLLDISGSMSGDRLDNAKSSLIEQVKMIPDGSVVSLITFETEIQDIIINRTVDENARKEIIEKIKAITDRGTTSLHAALKRAIELLRSYKGDIKVKKIILISDGDPTDVSVKTGDENDPNYKQYFILAKEALEYKASIDTVGALGEHNVYLMYEIAKQSTGKYIFAENEEELKTKMIIATEQTIKIAFSQPTLVVRGLKGEIQLEDAAQYKPTVIRMPFEKVGKDFKTFFRSFEAGDTYQILIKGKLSLDKANLPLDVPVDVLDLDFDFGEPGLKVNKKIQVKFTNDQTKFRLNQDINKKYAGVFTQAQEIADCTIRGDASATQKIQGDETKKISE
jgi:uncharacterized protein YegL